MFVNKKKIKEFKSITLYINSKAPKIETLVSNASYEITITNKSTTATTNCRTHKKHTARLMQ